MKLYELADAALFSIAGVLHTATKKYGTGGTDTEIELGYAFSGTRRPKL
jgi:hypothetical protein